MQNALSQQIFLFIFLFNYYSMAVDEDQILGNLKKEDNWPKNHKL